MLTDLIRAAKLVFNDSVVSHAPVRVILNQGNRDNRDSRDDDSASAAPSAKAIQFRQIYELVDSTKTKSMWTDMLESEYLKRYGKELNMYGLTLPALIRHTRGVNGVTSKNYDGRYFIAIKGDPRDEPDVSEDDNYQVEDQDNASDDEEAMLGLRFESDTQDGNDDSDAPEQVPALAPAPRTAQALDPVSNDPASNDTE
jgi:hypothetical protein